MTKVCIGFCSRAVVVDIVFKAKSSKLFWFEAREICTNLIETNFFGGSIWLGRKCGKVKSFV